MKGAFICINPNYWKNSIFLVLNIVNHSFFSWKSITFDVGQQEPARVGVEKHDAA